MAKVSTGGPGLAITVTSADSPFTVDPQIIPTVYADATSGAVTVNLCPAAAFVGSPLLVKAIGTTSNLVTVQAAGSDLIDGSSSVTLGASGTSPGVTLVSDGTQWRATALHGTPGSVLMEVVPSGDTTGVTDTTAIQNAINTVSAAAFPNQGGIVRLKNGTYWINSTLTVTVDNVTIEGDGLGNPTGNRNTNSNPQYGGAVLFCRSAFIGSYVLKFGQSGTPARTLSGCFLKNVSIDGSSLPASVGGIFWQVFKGGGEHVYVYKPTGNGIVIDGNTSFAFPQGAWDNHFYNWTSEGAGGQGWVFQNYATDNMLTSCVSKYATGDGVYIDANSPSNRFDATCYVYSCSGNGFNIQTAMETKIIGVRIQDVNGGIYVNAGSNGHGGTLITGCTLRNCSATTDNTTDAIQITGGVTTGACIIAGNHFQTDQGNTNGNAGGNQYNRPRYLINIASANVQNVVIGDWSAGSTGSGYGGGTGYAGTQAINDAAGSIYTGSVGQTGYPELRQGSLRWAPRTSTPNSNMAAGVGSFTVNVNGGHGTTAYVKESGSGNTGWVALGSRTHRKATVTATPSATLNTNGATQTVSPGGDYYSFVCQQVRLVSGGTFASETLTVNVTFTFSDASTQTFSQTFTVTNTTYDLTAGNLNVNAFKDGLQLVSVGVNCQSTINSSAANVAATVAAVNG